MSAVSWLYVLYYQRARGRSWLVSAMVAFSLSVTLLVVVIIPVDVYAISSMKTKDGNFEPWASRNATRQHIENTIMTGYYGGWQAVERWQELGGEWCVGIGELGEAA